MIKLRDLSYCYSGGRFALSKLDAEIGPGIHLLLGENGAGKTTLLRLMAGLLHPTSGDCEIDSENPSKRQPELLRRVFFLPDSLEIPAKSIRAFAELHSGFYPGFSLDTFEDNLHDFELSGDELFAQLSLGLKHKSLLAYVTALGVDVLLLDEPANGLDIMSKKTLRKILARTTGEDRTVIVSTHTITDLRELYDGVIVLSRGHLLLSCPSWEIAEKIACVTTPIPPENAIFVEQGPGVFHSILINNSEETAELNYGLLYSALLSPSRERLLSILKEK